jgi:hypothetical protein
VCSPRRLIGAAGGIAFAVRLYFTYFYAEQFTRYPPTVAKALRRALYYSNNQKDPKLALKYYKIALEQCDEMRLDPFSDEVMGIKIQLAAWLEQVGYYDNAGLVLEALLADCRRWVEVMETAVRDGTTAKMLPVLLPPSNLLDKDDKQPGADAPAESLWGKRTRVLAKAVGVSVKLGDLYANEHVLKPELAQQQLIWAVETALKEVRRRHDDGLKEGEGAWMSAEAIGATLECERTSPVWFPDPST